MSNREKAMAMQPDTLDRLAGLRDAVEFARYEVGVAIIAARRAGARQVDIAEAIGVSQPAVSQWVKRAGTDVPDEEVYRVGRLLGLVERAVRWEVRTITSGRAGVSRVNRSTVSTHLDRAVAEARCDARDTGAPAGSPGAVELWRVEPSGQAQRVRVRPLPERVERVAVEGGADDESF